MFQRRDHRAKPAGGPRSDQAPTARRQWQLERGPRGAVNPSSSSSSHTSLSPHSPNPFAASQASIHSSGARPAAPAGPSVRPIPPLNLQSALDSILASQKRRQASGDPDPFWRPKSAPPGSPSPFSAGSRKQPPFPRAQIPPSGDTRNASRRHSRRISDPETHSAVHLGLSTREELPAPTLSKVVLKCLETLNDPTKSFPPRLPNHIVRHLYHREKSLHAPDVADEHQALKILRPRLAEAIYKTKLNFRRNAQLPLPEVHVAEDDPMPGVISTATTPPVTPQPTATMSSLFDQFLVEVNNIVARGDARQLQEYLKIEPPYPEMYTKLIDEIRANYPRVTKHGYDDERLEEKVASLVPEAEGDMDGGEWGALTRFIATWAIFVRDVNVEDLLQAYEGLSDLLGKANSALGHHSKGIVLLPTVIELARIFARLAVGLDKQPELIAHLVRVNADDEDGSVETLPEKAANVIRQGLNVCLNARGASLDGVIDGKPERKKIGIYKLANICLKMLFQCDQIQGCEQIFTNIHKSSPPLAIYPAAERVTYLYYLGRFHFATTNFYPALMALQEAYDHCLVQDGTLKNRQIILIYLVTANLICGRFPSAQLYGRQEAAGLRERFSPICRAIQTGNLETFRRLTGEDSEHFDWFWKYRILNQIRTRCEVYIWRSLIRKVFLLAGDVGDEANKKPPILDLHHVLTAFQYCEKRLWRPASHAAADQGPGRRNLNMIFNEYKPALQLTGRELSDMSNIESKVTSLVYQGFLIGFLTRGTKKFAITGARNKNPLEVGFPTPWEVIKEDEAETECPGWRRSTADPFGNQPGPGMVVNLSGARPVGSFG